jgi:hypothetical protein
LIHEHFHVERCGIDRYQGAPKLLSRIEILARCGIRRNANRRSPSPPVVGREAPQGLRLAGLFVWAIHSAPQQPTWQWRHGFRQDGAAISSRTQDAAPPHVYRRFALLTERSRGCTRRSVATRSRSNQTLTIPRDIYSVMLNNRTRRTHSKVTRSFRKTRTSQNADSASFCYRLLPASPL